MKVLFTNQPGSGHWHPLVPLAKALEAGGHDVAFASIPGVGPAIESNGFRFFPAGLDESLEDMQERQARHTNSNPAEHGNYMQAYVFAGVRAERSLPDLLNIISDWHPDILVRENTEYGGYVAAERAGIPHATVQITAFRPHLMEVVTEPLNRLHASVGLPPQPPQGVLVPLPIAYAAPTDLVEPGRPYATHHARLSLCGFQPVRRRTVAGLGGGLRAAAHCICQSWHCVQPHDRHPVVHT